MPIFDTPFVIGVIATALTFGALVRQSNKGLLGILGFSVFLWAIHYGLLGSVSGFAVHAVAACSLFVAHWTLNASLMARSIGAVGFSGAGVATCWVFGSGIEDALAAAGCVVITTSQFVARGNAMRLGFMSGETIFFGFALMVGSMPGMVVTAGNFAAGVVGLVRRYRAARVDFA